MIFGRSTNQELKMENKSNPSKPSGHLPPKGYKHPPKDYQFRKGQSGNPSGRPKKSRNVLENFRKLLDGDQVGKNGEVVSRREAIVLKIVKDAMGGNQRAFTKFLDLLEKSGLFTQVAQRMPSSIQVKTKTMTAEEYAEFKRKFYAYPKPNMGRTEGEDR